MTQLGDRGICERCRRAVPLAVLNSKGFRRACAMPEKVAPALALAASLDMEAIIKDVVEAGVKDWSGGIKPKMLLTDAIDACSSPAMGAEDEIVWNVVEAGVSDWLSKNLMQDKWQKSELERLRQIHIRPETSTWLGLNKQIQKIINRVTDHNSKLFVHLKSIEKYVKKKDKKMVSYHKEKARDLIVALQERIANLAGDSEFGNYMRQLTDAHRLLTIAA